MSEQRLTLRFDSFRSFLDECSAQVSEEGIFLATEEIRPVGSIVAFDLGLDSDFPILRGSGEVLWVVEPNGGDSAPGMAVRFESTDDATATLVRRIVERRRAEDRVIFDLAPPPVEEEEPEAVAEPLSYATQAVATLSAEEVEAMKPAAEAEPAGPETPAVPPIEEPGTPAPPPIEEPETPTVPPLEEPETPAAPIEEPEPATRPADAFEPATLESAELSELESTEAAPTEGAAPSSMPPYLEQAGAAAASTKRSRTGLWAALAAVAVLAGVGYWQRDLLTSMLSGGGPDPVPAAAEMVELPVEEIVEAPVAELEAIEFQEQAPVELEPAVPAAPSGPMSRIEEVQWLASDDGTVLRLLANGAFPQDSYTIERLVDPPRLLLKIAGVTAPLATPNMAVGSDEVVGIRTALHGTEPSTSLHVVVDLADPTAQVSDSESADGMLQVRIASGAISP